MFLGSNPFATVEPIADPKKIQVIIRLSGITRAPMALTTNTATASVAHTIRTNTRAHAGIIHRQLAGQSVAGGPGRCQTTSRLTDDRHAPVNRDECRPVGGHRRPSMGSRARREVVMVDHEGRAAALSGGRSPFQV